jgi:hypothetical protein
VTKEQFNDESIMVARAQQLQGIHYEGLQTSQIANRSRLVSKPDNRYFTFKDGDEMESSHQVLK